MKKTIYRLVVVAIFFAFLSCGESGTLKSSTPSDVVKAMVESIVGEDFDAFIALNINKKGDLSEKKIKETKGLMSFIKEDIDKKGGLKEVIIVEEKISEDGLTATVKIQMAYNTGKKAAGGKTKLIKVDGVWKIKSL